VKIFKYLLLLLLLFSFAFFVFVFTKDGRYAFEEKMTINIGKDVVVPYIEDNKQWPVWFEFDFPIDQLKISETSIIWDKNINKIKKTFSTDSIKYQFKFKDIDYITYLKIKGNRGKTEVIWRGSGEMTFQEKLFYYLPFETSTSIQDKLKKSLAQLKGIVTTRYLNHDIVFGKVELYPSQELFLSPFTSTPDSLIFNRYRHEKKLDSIFNQ
jgi:hypothetical protein